MTEYNPNPVARLDAIVASEKPPATVVTAEQNILIHQRSADVMKLLFPKGLPYPGIVHEPNFQMVESLTLKLVRFAELNLRCNRTAHDLASYRHMMEED